MKKLFGLLILLVLALPIMAQEKATKSVPISETERIVDKYLAKAGSVIDSTFTKVAPMAEKAFVTYSKGYQARGTISFWSALTLLILSFVLICVGVLGAVYGNEEELCGVIAGVSGIVFVVTLLLFAICVGDWYTMMKAPDYWVIKDLLKAI